MSPNVLVYALRALEQATRDVIKSKNIEKAGETIKKCSIAAAVAGVGTGWLPGAGAIVASVAWVAAIWGMYVKVNIDLGISIKKNAISLSVLLFKLFMFELFILFSKIYSKIYIRRTFFALHYIKFK